jgi:hypothetical protein
MPLLLSLTQSCHSERASDTEFEFAIPPEVPLTRMAKAKAGAAGYASCSQKPSAAVDLAS